MDIKKMTLEEKVGQLFIIGFNSNKIDNQIITLIEKHNVGNVILFQRNLTDMKSLRVLNENIQELMIKNNKIQAFISMDQEGGVVSRISEGSTLFPGNMAVAASNIHEITKELGNYVGKELSSVGVNMNLSPVLDVNNNPKNPVIGVRSYGDDPYKVGELGYGMIKGLKDSGIIAVAKHFPGHGDTSVDSHLALPTVHHSIERLDKIELIPFKECINKGIDAIMSSHIMFPKLGVDKPATLSKEILTNLLREKLGFNGLIVSDCMEMKAIDDFYGIEESSIMAIEAGVNLICVSHTLEKQVKAIESVIRAVKEGRLSVELIDERVSRILKYKEKYIVNTFKKYEFDEDILNNYKSLVKNISEKSITIVRDKESLVPIRKKVAYVISPISKAYTIAEDRMKELNFAEEFSKILDSEFINYDLENINIQNIVDRVNKDDFVIFGVINLINNDKLQKLLNSLYEKTSNIILIALKAPYDLSYNKEKFTTAIAAYEYTQLSMDSIKKVLTGEIRAVGKLPVDIY